MEESPKSPAEREPTTETDRTIETPRGPVTENPEDRAAADEKAAETRARLSKNKSADKHDSHGHHHENGAVKTVATAGKSIWLLFKIFGQWWRESGPIFGKGNGGGHSAPKKAAAHGDHH
jgi:hypothetical protein